MNRRTPRKKPGDEVEKRTLTPKQQRFVAEYLVDVNATQAAIRAGYSTKTAQQIGAENLLKPVIAAAVHAKQEQHLEKIDFVVEDVLRAVQRHVRADGRADVRDLFQKGRLLDPQAWSDDAAMNVAGFDVVKRNITSGDGLVDTIIKVKVKDQSRYVEMGMKHFGLLLERLHLTTDAEVMKILDAGRQHAHERNRKRGGKVA